MADLFLLDGSNWMEFFNKKYCFVMFTKSDCEQCKILEKLIITSNFESPIPLTKLMLDRPGFAELKQSQSLDFKNRHSSHSTQFSPKVN